MKIASLEYPLSEAEGSCSPLIGLIGNRVKVTQRWHMIENAGLDFLLMLGTVSSRRSQPPETNTEVWFVFVFFLSESSWHSLKNGRDKEKGPRTHTHRHDNVPLMNVEYDKEAPYRFALDRDTPINLTRHRQTNGSPYCLVTHRNEFRNEWIKYRCYLYHDTAKLPIVVIFFFFFCSGFPQYTYYLYFLFFFK